MRSTDDVAHNINRTTLGPYSFHVLVATAWTGSHVAAGAMPRGRRTTKAVGSSNRKRPLADDILQQTKRAKRQKTLQGKENMIPPSDSVPDPIQPTCGSSSRPRRKNVLYK